MTTPATVSQELSAAWQRQEKLDMELREARAKVRELTQQAIDLLYPPHLLQERFIPLSPTTGLAVHRVEMRPPLVEGQAPYWAAIGHKVRFRVGSEEAVGPFTLEQPAYEALSEDVRNLTRQAQRAASKEQKLTGINAPLKLTDRQCEMFALLVNNNERLAFSSAAVDGGQRLPSAIWDSQSSTQAIWSAMVKRGVLEIVQGTLSDPYSKWRVNPGPRFPDAVVLVAKHLHGLRPNVPATRQFYEKFGLKPPSPAAPSP